MMTNVASPIARVLFNLRRKVLASPLINSKLLPALPRSVRWALRKAYFLPYDLLNRANQQTDELVPPLSLIHDGGVDQFKRIGEVVVRRQLIGIGGLQPTDAVLDIGCGIGRQAVALTQVLANGGRYEGIDIVPDAIAWCQANITPRYSNFKFQLADIYNKEYNPKGKLHAQEYRLPFVENTFDFVFLTSVFTHMLPDDIKQYVSEIARVLKPGGKCFATYFLLNEESLRLMAEGRSVVDYKYDYGIYRVVSNTVPELNISFDEAWVVELFKQYGLELNQPIYHGGWDGRNGGTPNLGQQDIVVARKVATSS